MSVRVRAISLLFASVFVAALLSGAILLHGAAAAPYRLVGEKQKQPGEQLGPGCLQWSQVASPDPLGNTTLVSLTALSANNVWAVGTYVDGTTPHALIVHWDGQSWSQTPSPAVGRLNSVSASGPNDIWAVGLVNENTTLTLHWDGISWAQVPSPSPRSGSILTGVAALSSNDAWAVGYSGSELTYNTLILHWDGMQWSQANAPNPNYLPRLSDVKAVSANDVWAVGTYRPDTNAYAALFLHWNGTEWSVSSSPPVAESRLNRLSVRAANDIWAVGTNEFGDYTLTVHWNGSTWTVVSSPNGGNLINSLGGVAALAQDNAWAVGFTYSSGQNTPLSLVAHWDGANWSPAVSPAPGSGNVLNDVAGVAADDVWAVGYYTDAIGQHLLIEHYYNHCVTPPAPTQTATLTPIPTSCPVTYSDVHPTDYFYEAVRYLSCRGAISGYSDGTFRPYNDTTRGQLSKIVVQAEGFAINTAGGPHFTDVPASNPFYPFIETAFNRGLISGYSDQTFRWGANITRGQLSKVVVQAEGWPINTSGGPHFTDVATTNPFYAFIETAYNRGGIISGYSDGTFRPANNATRGQIAKIVFSAVSAP